MLHDRVHIYILGSRRRFGRDVAAARAAYDSMLVPLGARHGGVGLTDCGDNPAHFYVLDQPTEDQLAELLVLHERGTQLELVRSYRDSDHPEPYSLKQIISDIGAVICPLDPSLDSFKTARCWSGVKVMEAMIAKLAA